LSGEREISVEELLAESAGLHVLAQRLVGGTALDLVQESLLASLQQSARPRAVREWLHGVARKQAALFWRKERHRVQREEQAAVPERLPSASELAEQAEIHHILAEEVVALREPYRSSVILRFYHGLSPEEIAARVEDELSVAGVRTRVKRGVAMLRERLRERYGGRREDWIRAFAPIFLPGATPTVSRWAAGKLAIALLVVAGSSTAYFIHRVRSPGEEQQAVLIAPRVEQESHLVNSADDVRGSSRRVLETPRATRTVTLRLVDAFDKEPLAYSGVGTRGGGQRWTDGDGRIELQVASDVQEVELEVRGERSSSPGLECPVNTGAGILEDASSIPVVVHEFDDVIPVDVDVGPTYFLDLGLLARTDPERFEAHLTRSGAETSVRRQCPDYAPVRMSPGEDRAWVRFPTLELGQTGPWTLEVFDKEGTSYGRATVDSIRGTSLAPVTIELESRATLRLHVKDWGGATDAPVQFALRSLETDAVITQPTSGAGGHYRFDALPPGAYELELRTSFHEPFARELQLRAGEVHTETVYLESSVLSSGIRGELRSESGTFREEVLLVLESTSGRNTQQLVHPEWTEQRGEWV